MFKPPGLESLISSFPFEFAVCTYLNRPTLEAGDVKEWRFVLLAFVLLLDLPLLGLQVQDSPSLKQQITFQILLWRSLVVPADGRGWPTDKMFLEIYFNCHQTGSCVLLCMF